MHQALDSGFDNLKEKRHSLSYRRDDHYRSRLLNPSLHAHMAPFDIPFIFSCFLFSSSIINLG